MDFLETADADRACSHGRLDAASLVRTPPDMRVVTKGWWVLREQRVSMAELAREDRGGDTGG